ncbi:hypothetical protein DXV76_15545 [Rhodobacteraceae bacterium CCMM004]|nr:hypothetical protein DXV76_15545 [Rhodobacteraceae bacterium CCMM004]
MKTARTRWMRMTGLLMGAALAAGCGAVTPGGLAAVSRLDPLTVAPAGLAAAVAVPDRLRLTDGDAEMHMTVERGDGGVEVDERFDLRLSQPADAPAAGAGERVYVARLSPADAERFAVAQARVRALRAAGVQGSGQLSIGVTGGCLERGGALTDLPVRTWLSDGSGGFVALTGRRDLLEELDPETAAALRAGIAGCG